MKTEHVADMITEAVARHSMNSARTAQSNEGRLGASEIGVCREYLRNVIVETERREEEGVPWKAFIGTALGDAVESAVAKEFDVSVQTSVTATLPSGLTVPGHVDLWGETNFTGRWDVPVDPGWVGDLKSKDGTRLIRTLDDCDRAHLYQIRLYHLALVQGGQILPNAPAFLIYLDRSGGRAEPVVIEVPTGDEFIAEIDDWLDDVLYAVRTGEQASRDRAYSWCEVACPFFWTCRGADEQHPTGNLIEDESQLHAIKSYREGKAMEKEGKALADEARDALVGTAGTTPDGFVLSWTNIGESTYSVTRAASSRLNIRALKR